MVMRCHYTYDKKAGKVHIPGCVGSAVFGPQACTCRSETFDEFENERYERTIGELRRRIAGLEQENVRLCRIIRKLIHKQQKRQ